MSTFGGTLAVVAASSAVEEQVERDATVDSSRAKPPLLPTAAMGSAEARFACQQLAEALRREARLQAQLDEAEASRGASEAALRSTQAELAQADSRLAAAESVLHDTGARLEATEAALKESQARLQAAEAAAAAHDPRLAVLAQLPNAFAKAAADIQAGKADSVARAWAAAEQLDRQ